MPSLKSENPASTRRRCRDTHGVRVPSPQRGVIGTLGRLGAWGRFGGLRLRTGLVLRKYVWLVWLVWLALDFPELGRASRRGMSLRRGSLTGKVTRRRRCSRSSLRARRRARSCRLRRLQFSADIRWPKRSGKPPWTIVESRCPRPSSRRCPCGEAACWPDPREPDQNSFAPSGEGRRGVLQMVGRLFELFSKLSASRDAQLSVTAVPASDGLGAFRSGQGVNATTAFTGRIFHSVLFSALAWAGLPNTGYFSPK